MGWIKAFYSIWFCSFLFYRRIWLNWPEVNKPPLLKCWKFNSSHSYFFFFKTAWSGNICIVFNELGARPREPLEIGWPLKWECRRVLTSHVSDKAESQADCWDARVSSSLHHSQWGTLGFGVKCSFNGTEQSTIEQNACSPHWGNVHNYNDNAIALTHERRELSVLVYWLFWVREQLFSTLLRNQQC